MSHARGYRRQYDAIIVGARCAGAATAMLLARKGLNVLAIDRHAYGADTLSTHALMRGAVLQLSRWGLLDQVIAVGTPPVRRTSFHYGDECIDIDIKPDHGVDRLFAPRRMVLDRILVDGAVRAGADVRHGVVFTEIDSARDGRVSGIVISDESGAQRTLRAPIVIGADGRYSLFAKSVAARRLRTSAHCSAAIYGYYSGLRNEGFRWYYRPGVSVGAIPTNDGQTCVFASLPPSRFHTEIRAGAATLFERIARETSPQFAIEIACATRHGRLRGFPGIAGHMNQSYGPGWALVGDAAYFKDPLTAHGITDALRDAELLSRAIMAGSEHALARYQQERDALSTDLFGVTDEIASFEWSLEKLKQQHLRLNKAMKAETASIAALVGPMQIAA